jgi:hypothetical protein
MTIERAFGVIRTRSTVLVLRKAFYGATRFEQFTAPHRPRRRDHLRPTTRAGVGRHPRQAPYQQPGQRRRYEYVLTSAGAELMPAPFGLDDPISLETWHGTSA